MPFLSRNDQPPTDRGYTNRQSQSGAPRQAFKIGSAPADSVLVQLPSVNELGAELEALRKEAVALPEDHDDVLEHVANLRALAVYLNVHLVPPVIHEA